MCRVEIHLWSGLLHLSHPSLPSRPLASLLDTLYLPSYDTRKTILDLVYKSLRLQVEKVFGPFRYRFSQVPDWTDEFEVAMRTADPSAPRDSWKLTEGFVAAEGLNFLLSIRFLTLLSQVKIFFPTLQNRGQILLRRRLHSCSPVTCRFDFHLLTNGFGTLESKYMLP